MRSVSGPFSVGIYDAISQRVVLVRDQIGVMPLYFSAEGSSVIFSDDIQALCSSSARPVKHNVAYLAKIWLRPHAPYLGPMETHVHGINQVPPGGWVCFNSNGEMTSGTYWPYDVDEQGHIERGDHGEFRELFDDVLVSYVKGAKHVAVLVGGFDSSTVLCTLDRLNKQGRINCQLSAITVSFDSRPSVNERPFVADVCKLIGASLSVIPGDECWDMRDPWDRLPPLHEPAGLLLKNAMLTRIAKTAGELKVDVLLTGEGGDYVLNGQLEYLADLMAEFRLRELIRDILYWRAGANISPWLLLRQHVLGPILEERLKGRSLKSHKEWPPPKPSVYFSDPGNLVRPWMTEVFLREASACLSTRERRGGTPWIRYAHRPMMAALQNQGQFWNERYIDPVFGLRRLHPFMDYRIVEFMMKVPQRGKMLADNGRIAQKQFARQAFKGYLPERVRRRGKQFGFNFRFSEFMRREWQAVEGLLSDSRLQDLGYLDSMLLREELRRWAFGYNGLIYNLDVELCLEIYLRNLQRFSSVVADRRMVHRSDHEEASIKEGR